MKEKELKKNGGYVSPEISEDSIAVESGFAATSGESAFGTQELQQDDESIMWQ